MVTLDTSPRPPSTTYGETDRKRIDNLVTLDTASRPPSTTYGETDRKRIDNLVTLDTAPHLTTTKEHHRKTERKKMYVRERGKSKSVIGRIRSEGFFTLVVGLCNCCSRLQQHRVGKFTSSLQKRNRLSQVRFST